MSQLAKKLNFHFTDQTTYLEGFHRSGWAYVMQNLERLQDENGIWCDTYVDRTFHWTAPNYIPYVRDWVGFVHHTFDTTFSDYNNVQLLKNPNFLESLTTCKGLFVFSKRQMLKWRAQLNKRGFTAVVVTALIHPTEFAEEKFTMTKFHENEKRKLVQVGAWLRNNYAIYKLNNGKRYFRFENDTVISKAALIGPQMENYYKPLDFFRIFKRQQWKKHNILPPNITYSSNDENGGLKTLAVTSIISINGEIPQAVVQETDHADGMCRNIVCRDSDYALNKYVIGAMDLLKTYDDSVTIISTLENNDYDDLLSQNIVFLSLVDAAAINTLQECIVRNTPIVVNKLPAVVEILGEDYPLYYENLDEISGLITLEKIADAYDYLYNMNKEKLTIDYFVNQIATSTLYQELAV